VIRLFFCSPTLPKVTLRITAQLQAGYKPYLYESAAGGHGYGKENKERASFTALGYNFLRSTIGWTQDRGREE
jgi:prolyl oligopeptidase